MFYDRKVGICRGRPSCRVGVYVFYNRLRYYCTNINTEVLYPLERAKVFAVPPLQVQIISPGVSIVQVVDSGPPSSQTPAPRPILE